MVLPSRSAQEGVRICRAETREIFVVEMSVVDFASAQIAFHEKSAAVIGAGKHFARYCIEAAIGEARCEYVRRRYRGDGRGCLRRQMHISKGRPIEQRLRCPRFPELSQRRAPVSISQSPKSGGRAPQPGVANDMKRSWLDGESVPPNR